MKHGNNNPLVVTSIVTTGPHPDVHEMVQIAFVVSDDWLQPYNKVVPFYFTMRPQHPERANEHMKVGPYLNGEDQMTTAGLFSDWFDSLNLPPGKQLELLCFDAPYVREFLRIWMFTPDFDRMISKRVRDVKAYANAMNDRACFVRKEYPCPKPQKLSYIATRFGVSNRQPGDALHDALSCLETYRRMVGTQL
jgi:hypothetical protein